MECKHSRERVECSSEERSDKQPSPNSDEPNIQLDRVKEPEAETAKDVAKQVLTRLTSASFPDPFPSKKCGSHHLHSHVTSTIGSVDSICMVSRICFGMGTLTSRICTQIGCHLFSLTL